MKKSKAKPQHDGFGLQPPEDSKPKHNASDKITTPTPETPQPESQQPKPPASVFPPLDVSGLGTAARGQFRDRLGFRRSPRSYDGSAVMLITEDVRRKIEPEYPDLRSRPRSPLV